MLTNETTKKPRPMTKPVNIFLTADRNPVEIELNEHFNDDTMRLLHQVLVIDRGDVRIWAFTCDAKAWLDCTRDTQCGFDLYELADKWSGK